MITRRSLLVAPLAGLLPPGLAFAAAADDYPKHLIRIIAPVGAGSGTDACARLVATTLGKDWQQPVIVENKVGAGGVIGTDYVAKAQPDGYTLLFTFASHYTNQWIDKTPYDAVKDFEPIARLASSALVLIVAPGSPFKSVKDIIAAAKQKPGGLTYGTAGSGTTGHMAGALLSSMAGVSMTHVPYKTPAQAALDAAAGLVDFGFNGLATALPLIKGGRLRAVAVTTARRSSHLPDIPTVAESGYPGFENSSPIWMLAPRGTPQPVIDKLSAALLRVAGTQEFKDLCMHQGLEVDVQDAAACKAGAPAELEKWRRLVALTAAKAS